MRLTNKDDGDEQPYNLDEDWNHRSADWRSILQLALDPADGMISEKKMIDIFRVHRRTISPALQKIIEDTVLAYDDSYLAANPPSKKKKSPKLWWSYPQCTL